MKPEVLVSFGFKYNDPRFEPGEIFHSEIIDVRKRLPRNPHRLKGLRYLRGTDKVVADDIESAPGFAEAYQDLKEHVQASQCRVILLGCTAGRHRSVYVAERLGQDLGIADVRHLHIDWTNDANDLDMLRRVYTTTPEVVKS